MSVFRIRWVAFALVLLFLAAPAWAEEAAAIERRLAEATRYLASEELEGRGVGTKGIDLAAEYLAAQFKQLGAKTDLLAGGPFQKFSLPTAVKMGPINRLVFLGPPSKDAAAGQRVELKPGEDFTPMAMSGSCPLDLPLVFAGYGITGKTEKYDDYAGLDVKGKAVVLLRHEPQQADPKSVFNGVNPSEHAPFTRKVANAREHGAAAVVFVSDEFDVQKTVARIRKQWQGALDQLAQEHANFKKNEKPTFEQVESQRKRIEELTRQVTACSERLKAEYDPLASFEVGGRDCQAADFPVVYCRRSAVDRVLKAAAGSDLAALEHQIDRGPTPQSRTLPGWKVQGEVRLERTEREVRNVVAAWEGRGPRADETIVIGAHYDHIGTRTSGPPGKEQKTVFTGADDNASGVAVLLEVARAVSERKDKPRRRVVFVAFAAEESGLVGSNYYVRNPPFPLEKTVAMLNLDMVGRLRDDKLIVGGSGTSPRFNALIDALAPRCALRVTKNPAGFGPSDQLPFFAKKIPVMHFFTGLHEDYHRSTDRPEKLNVPGMRRIAALVSEITVALAEDADRPQFTGGSMPVEFLRFVGQELISRAAESAAKMAGR